MRKLIVPMLLGISAMTLLTGCLMILGPGSATPRECPTIGQQLIDLQKAKDAGALSDSEYQAQKAKLLGHK